MYSYDNARRQPLVAVVWFSCVRLPRPQLLLSLARITCTLKRALSFFTFAERRCQPANVGEIKALSGEDWWLDW